MKKVCQSCISLSSYSQSQSLSGGFKEVINFVKEITKYHSLPGTSSYLFLILFVMLHWLQEIGWPCLSSFSYLHSNILTSFKGGVPTLFFSPVLFFHNKQMHQASSNLFLGDTSDNSTCKLWKNGREGSGQCSQLAEWWTDRERCLHPPGRRSGCWGAKVRHWTNNDQPGNCCSNFSYSSSVLP